MRIFQLLLQCNVEISGKRIAKMTILGEKQFVENAQAVRETLEKKS